MKRNRLYLLLLPLLALFASCEVEFSPNADWKEIPVVYCVLDQGDDTSWVRVEKCYLSDDDLYTPASISDSINYPAGALQVSLLQRKSDGSIVDSVDFIYTERDHAEGSFASSSQPLYYYPTKGKLRNDCTYLLRIRRTSNGELLASAETQPVVQTTSSVVLKPNAYGNTGSKKFGFTPGSSCEIKWATLENGRLYQPIVRFYYAEYGDTMYTDIKCGRRALSNNATEMSLSYPRTTFLADLQAALQDDPNPKQYLKYVDIYMAVSNEDLNAYLTTVSSGSSVDQQTHIYSNIEGGLGVFGARRTHIFRTVLADESDVEGSGLYYFLKNLGVGIY